MSEVETPKILGVPMNLVGTTHWTVSFAGAHTMISPGPEGRFYWASCGALAQEASIEDCVAAIERDLLAIRRAIPEPNIDRDSALDEIERRYEHTPEDSERDYFREALNDAYNAGLAAERANEPAPEPADSGEIIAYLRKAIQVGIFGIPAEAVPGLQAQLSALAELGRLDQHYADIVRAAMAFDEGGDYGDLTAACARLRLAKNP